MVRPRPVVSLAAGLLAVLSGIVRGEDTPSPAREPIDRQPYRIRAFVSIDPACRIDARRRSEIVQAWHAQVGRFVGAPWELTVAEEEPPASSGLESLDPAAVAAPGADVDQVWLIRLDRRGAELRLSGRAYDTATRQLRPIHERPVPIVADLPRALLHFGLALFTPIAEVGEASGGGVTLHVRGAALEPSNPLGRVAPVGTVFEPVRLLTLPDGAVRALKIPFSFLKVEALEGTGARCAIVSALRDPLTRRVAQKNTLLAVGITPGASPTRLRFVTRADKAPAAGYVLTGRESEEVPPRFLGTTDREGRIVLEPGFARGLVVLRLLAGDVEPMVEFPAMPGETAEERTVPFDPKPQAVALETQLESLRDAVLDLIAVRARLEARLKARSEGEDWAEVEAALKEFDRLPRRAVFADRLTQLKDAAARQQAQAKTAILTKTAQARLADVQALIDRYLIDDAVQAYAEALERAKAEKGKPPK